MPEVRSQQPPTRIVSGLHDAPHVEADDRATWRRWLAANHEIASGAWLVTWRACSGRGGLDYEAAVEEATLLRSRRRLARCN